MVQDPWGPQHQPAVGQPQLQPMLQLILDHPACSIAEMIHWTWALKGEFCCEFLKYFAFICIDVLDSYLRIKYLIVDFFVVVWIESVASAINLYHRSISSALLLFGVERK